MGAYLSQPNTVKSSGDGAGLGPRPLHFGFSAMQGWRVSMEDAHNCIPELDSETAMFSVYDGHGEWFDLEGTTKITSFRPLP